MRQLKGGAISTQNWRILVRWASTTAPFKLSCRCMLFSLSSSAFSGPGFPSPSPIPSRGGRRRRRQHNTEKRIAHSPSPLSLFPRRKQSERRLNEGKGVPLQPGSSTSSSSWHGHTVHERMHRRTTTRLGRRRQQTTCFLALMSLLVYLSSLHPLVSIGVFSACHPPEEISAG